MTAKKITIPEVYKKDLKVIMFLTIFGGVTYLSRQLGANEVYSIIFGATADYIAYRSLAEAKGEGYIKAIRNK